MTTDGEIEIIGGDFDRLYGKTMYPKNYFKKRNMKIVRMKMGFWLIPERYWTKDVKVIYFLWWKFIFKWKNTKPEFKKNIFEKAE